MPSNPASAYHATDGAAYHVFLGRWTERLADATLDALELPDDGAVLDVGCGTGRITCRALRRCDPDLRQPDRRTPGVRITLEKTTAPRALLIVVDPRRIDLVRTPHVDAAHHLPLLPVPTSQCSPHSPTCRHRRLSTKPLCASAATDEFQIGCVRIRTAQQSGSSWQAFRCSAQTIRDAARLYATGGNARSTTPCVTSTARLDHRDAIANLAMRPATSPACVV